MEIKKYKEKNRENEGLFSVLEFQFIYGKTLNLGLVIA